jgi:hypothetical protein
MNYGATQDEQIAIEIVIGVEDTLPVVSNPNAKVAKSSTLKEIGKVPSIYNRAGEVVGISKWTEKYPTLEEYLEWCKNPDYGICIQTRRIRPIDIDVDDRENAQKIVKFVAEHLGFELPMRYRSNSGKCLLMCRVEGEIPKRRMIVEGGVVEYLGNGQQFIACGTHPSGVRYEWVYKGVEGFPTSIPELSIGEYEALIAALEAEFATAPIAKGSIRKRGERIEGLADPIANKLIAKGLDTGLGTQGQIFLKCPFEHEHSAPGGSPTATAYFPAGTGGYKNGIFICKHAHCDARPTFEFESALGLVEGELDGCTELADSLGITVGEVSEALPRPLEVNNNGEATTCLANLVAALQRPHLCGYVLKYDKFRDSLLIASWSKESGPGKMTDFDDSSYGALILALETTGFEPIRLDRLKMAVELIAKENQIDTAIEWINSPVWDGIPRVERFVQNYLGCVDTEYSTAVGQYLWTALAGRVLDPGCKADMVPILVGAQGIRKSTVIEKIVPRSELFGDIDLNARDTDLSRKMRGKLVLEIAELRGLKTRDLESIKQFITRTHEEWIPKYKEFSKQYPRRCVFIGSTNEPDFLADTTGNRRWLPLTCGIIDIAGLERDRLQLWAEGRELFLQHGVLYADAERLAEEVHEAHHVPDIQAEMIERWLEGSAETVSPLSKGYITLDEVLCSCLGYDSRKVTRTEQNNAAKILRKLGLVSVVKRVGENHSAVRVWAR